MANVPPRVAHMRHLLVAAQGTGPLRPVPGYDRRAGQDTEGGAVTVCRGAGDESAPAQVSAPLRRIEAWTHTDSTGGARPVPGCVGAALRDIPEFFLMRSGWDQGHAGFTAVPGVATLAPWSPPSI